MKIFEDCLLVSDIDGTLAEGRYIPPNNIDAVGRFISDGGRVVLATGRSPQSSVPVAKALGCSGLVIANNGALVFDCESNRPIIQYELGCADIAFDIVQRFPAAGAMFYCGSQLWLLNSNPQMEALLKSERLTVLDKSDKMINKVLFSGHPQLLDGIEAYCSSIPDLDGDVVRSDDVYIEILPKGMNKGKAMLDLAADMGISRDKVFAAGNYYNDMAMLEGAAISCAPIESPEEVRAAADYVTCSCRNGAVADFIEYLYKKFEIRSQERS